MITSKSTILSVTNAFRTSGLWSNIRT